MYGYLITNKWQPTHSPGMLCERNGVPQNVLKENLYGGASEKVKGRRQKSISSSQYTYLEDAPRFFLWNGMLGWGWGSEYIRASVWGGGGGEGHLRAHVDETGEPPNATPPSKPPNGRPVPEHRGSLCEPDMWRWRCVVFERFVVS